MITTDSIATSSSESILQSQYQTVAIASNMNTSSNEIIGIVVTDIMVMPTTMNNDVKLIENDFWDTVIRYMFLGLLTVLVCLSLTLCLLWFTRKATIKREIEAQQMANENQETPNVLDEEDTALADIAKARVVSMNQIDLEIQEEEKATHIHQEGKATPPGVVATAIATGKLTIYEDDVKWNEMSTLELDKMESATDFTLQGYMDVIMPQNDISHKESNVEIVVKPHIDYGSDKEESSTFLPVPNDITAGFVSDDSSSSDSGIHLKNANKQKSNDNQSQNSNTNSPSLSYGRKVQQMVIGSFAIHDHTDFDSLNIAINAILEEDQD